jgi:hypothetical protein
LTQHKSKPLVDERDRLAILTEIVVTPEMMVAGAAVMAASGLSDRLAVADVYRAMRPLEPSTSYETLYGLIVAEINRWVQEEGITDDWNLRVLSEFEVHALADSITQVLLKQHLLLIR